MCKCSPSKLLVCLVPVCVSTRLFRERQMQIDTRHRTTTLLHSNYSLGVTYSMWFCSILRSRLPYLLSFSNCQNTQHTYLTRQTGRTQKLTFDSSEIRFGIASDNTCLEQQAATVACCNRQTTVWHRVWQRDSVTMKTLSVLLLMPGGRKEWAHPPPGWRLHKAEPWRSKELLPVQPDGVQSIYGVLLDESQWICDVGDFGGVATGVMRSRGLALLWSLGIRMTMRVGQTVVLSMHTPCISQESL